MLKKNTTAISDDSFIVEQLNSYFSKIKIIDKSVDKSEIGQDCRCTNRLTSVEFVTCFRSGLALASESDPKE